ncbi:MAG: hypothetical protein ABII96_07885 [Candidatus Zixiibacteriota bacterium]
MKIIKYLTTENIVKGEESSFNLFTVLFRDNAGNEYSWAPKWADLQLIFLRGCMTEYYNSEAKDIMPELTDFERIAQRVVDRRY